MFFIKKILIITSIIISILVFYKQKEQTYIPVNSIRIRIIANSNSIEDQNTKLLVKNKIEKELYTLTQNSKSIEETRTIINANIYNIDNLIANTLKENNKNENFTIKYGINYFPEKEYKGTTYQADNYESLVITLGNGEGENWWCVLFPPLCQIDAKEEQENIQYEFITKKIIQHFM